MNFGTLINKLRIEKGLTLEQVANMNYLTKQAVDNYEKGRRFCKFNEGVSIINSLGYNVIIENKDLKKDGALIMENNLEFVNFNVEEVKRDITTKIENEFKETLDNFSKQYDELQKQGFEIFLHGALNDKFGFAEYYGETDLITLEKNNKTICLEVIGHLEKEVFILENFIEELEKENNEIAKYIEKVIIFYCQKGYGEEIYNAFERKSEQKIVETMPLIKPYIKNVMQILTQECEKPFTFYLDYAYDPKEITIGYYLGILDDYNSPSLVYSYVDEYGDKHYPREYLEDVYIPNAMKLAESCFKDASSKDWNKIFEYSYERD